uniref:Polysaccharide biosynthesis domain-containing protein n=1 Tax=Mycena chlorophos TaxID=658473 RepID=A0ABQ0LZ55_MYCCL|nr:predicted protein [Mycena chlorophos]
MQRLPQQGDVEERADHEKQIHLSSNRQRTSPHSFQLLHDTMASTFDPHTAQNHIDVRLPLCLGSSRSLTATPPDRETAVEQAQTYWNLLEKVPPTELKLTRLDDEIYEDTINTFPELSENNYAGLIKLNEEWMKSPDGKERWRAFIERYKKKVKDYNFGSLIRTNSKEEYGEKNTIFVTRIQGIWVKQTCNIPGSLSIFGIYTSCEQASTKREDILYLEFDGGCVSKDEG